MAELRRDSTSSLQRKKPPWLKLDIPVPVVAAEEPALPQVPERLEQAAGSKQGSAPHPAAWVLQSMRGESFLFWFTAAGKGGP